MCCHSGFDLEMVLIFFHLNFSTDSLESLLLTDLTSPGSDLAVDSTNNGLDNAEVVDVCAEFGECDHIYEFPSIVEKDAEGADAAVIDHGGFDVPEGADVRFEQVYPDKGLPYYK